MKPVLFKREFNKIFQWFSNESVPGILKLEADFYKKLWNFLVLSDSFYFILNHHTLKFELVSKEVETVLGYRPGECTVEFLSSQLHPEDFSWFLSFGKAMADFFGQLPVDKITRYKVRHDMRYRHKNGNYVRILYQGLILEHDEHGRLLRSLGVNSDISYLKENGKPILSFIGMDGEPSFIDSGSVNSFEKNDDKFTRRELQVLHHLIEGRSSKEVSGILNISKQTVDTHRKNMIHKKNLNNTSELIAKAIRNGWI